MNRNPALLVCVFLVLLIPAPLRAEGEKTDETEVAPLPITASLDYVKEYLDEDPPRVVGTGRIEIRQGESSIVVEDGGVVLWVDAEKWRGLRSGEIPEETDELLGGTIREVYAEGDVRIVAEGQEVRAKRVYANFLEHRAIILGGEFLARIGEEGRGPRIPILVRAERIVQVAKHEIHSEDARITTDLYADPHHELRVSEMVLRFRGEEYDITARNLTLRYEGIPVFWLPWVRLGSTMGADPIRDINIGASSKFGYFFGVDLGYRLWSSDPDATEPWGDIEFRPVYRTQRGFGIEGVFEYDVPDFRGELLTAYQHDTATEDKVLREPVPREHRGRVRFQHFHEISKDLHGGRLHGIGEFSWLSDSGYLAEYYTSEYTEGKAQEDLLYGSWAGHSLALSLTGKWQANDYTTQTTYLPRAWGELFRTPVLQNVFGTDLDVLVSGEVGAARVNREFAEDSGLRGTRTDRLVARGQVDAPFNLGPVRVTPAFNAGYTLYSGDQDAQRLDLAASIRGAIDFWRVFPDVRSDTFDIHGIRHVIDVSAGYANRFGVSDGSDEIVSQDMYDLVDEIAAVDLRIRNRLETKRRGDVVRFVDFEVRALYFPDSLEARPAPFGEREEFQQGINSTLVPEEELWRAIPRRGWGPILGELRVQVLGNLFFAADGWYDAETRRFETYSEGLRYEGGEDGFSFLIAHRAIQDDASIVTGWIDTKLTDRWSIRLLHQQNLTRRQSLATGLNLRRRYPDFIVEFSARYNQKRNDTSFSISVEPSAVFDQRKARQSEEYLDFERMRWYR